VPEYSEQDAKSSLAKSGIRCRRFLDTAGSHDLHSHTVGEAPRLVTVLPIEPLARIVSWSLASRAAP
jgi:hypothetical protein